ncbi:hypothetical protein JCM8097_006298 [Rhodosporidiobolus ruineniae]
MTVPSSSSLASLVASSFSASRERGDIILYAHTSATPVSDDPRAGPGEQGTFTQFVHVVPDLCDKPAVPPKTPDLSKVGKRDVFAGPDFGPGEKVCDFEVDADDEQSDAEGEKKRVMYSVVHNLHALFPEHMMVIPHFGPKGTFRPQTSDLVPADLAAAWKVVEAYERDGRETIMFFNGGPLAGASQPHLHLQFTPFQHSLPPACEAVGRSLPFPPSPPSPTASPSSLAAQTGAGAARLPLPWVQFYLPVPSRPAADAGAAEQKAFQKELYQRYQTLLRTSRDYLASLPESSLPPAGPKRESYNLFLTSRYMHLVPRTDRLVRVPRVESRGQGEDVLVDDGSEEGKRRRVEEFRLSVNGLLYLGYFFVGTPEEASDLRRHGLAKTLREAGYANEEWEEGVKGEKSE